MKTSGSGLSMWVIICCWASSVISYGATIYVSPNGHDCADGSAPTFPGSPPDCTDNCSVCDPASPVGPKKTIQAGIHVATSGDVVLVAPGIYRGDGPAALETADSTSTGNRDIDFLGKAITVKSTDGPFVTIIDCESNGRAFIFQSEEDNSSVLEGFTITNGDVGNDDGQQ